MNHDLLRQTKNAFDFVQKLYFEISYLIKEVEGLLEQEEGNFVIGRPTGYGVTTKTSSGLGSVYVDNWLPKTFTVFFGPQEKMELQKGGITATPFDDSLKVLLLHIDVLGKTLPAPRLLIGCIYNIRNKRSDYKKFENLMSEFSYYNQKIFASLPDINYEDSYCSFNGYFIEYPLFSICNSDDVAQVVNQMLEIYRRIS